MDVKKRCGQVAELTLEACRMAQMHRQAYYDEYYFRGLKGYMETRILQTIGFWNPPCLWAMEPGCRILVCPVVFLAAIPGTEATCLGDQRMCEDLAVRHVHDEFSKARRGLDAPK